MKRTAFTTTCCTMTRRQAPAVESSLDGRTDSALRGGNSRSGGGRSFAGLQTAHAMVHRKSRPARATISKPSPTDEGPRRFLSLVNRTPLKSVLRYMLDENEFLSPYGIRALSRYHRDHPYILLVNGMDYRVDYEPAESSTGLFGGNSNWRGPIWFPVNFLLIESLQKFHFFLRRSITKSNVPPAPADMINLWEIAGDISQRLTNIFLRDAERSQTGFRRHREISKRPSLARSRPILRIFPWR